MERFGGFARPDVVTTRPSRPAIRAGASFIALVLLVLGLASPAHARQAACTNRGKLQAWSDRRLAMQTLAVPVQETSPGDVTKEVGAGAGGVLLFGSSAPSDLGGKLAQLESHAAGGLGILVMTDEEGGGVQRMANLVGSLPWAAWMGDHWTADQIRSHVTAVAARMYKANVDMDLAPVLDVDGKDVPPGSSDPDGWRSFSGTTWIVKRDGLAYMRGLTSSKVIAVLKHFPGLGGSSGNSDDGPAHTLPWPTLQRVAIPPFARAISAGAPAVMVANDTVPGLTSRPASLSRKVIVGELEQKLGFKGLVMTDAVNAGAVRAAGYTVPQASVAALKAGADMILFGQVAHVGRETNTIASTIVDAVQHGRLGRWRLIAAADAVLAVRKVDLCA